VFNANFSSISETLWHIVIKIIHQVDM